MFVPLFVSCGEAIKKYAGKPSQDSFATLAIIYDTSEYSGVTHNNQILNYNLLFPYFCCEDNDKL